MPSTPGPSTTILHRRRRRSDAHRPLTTPIYETSTYVFESAEAVRAYQEGRAPGYLYSRYENPTVVEVEKTLAGARGCGARARFSSGMAATDHALLTLTQAGRRSAVQRGDLRRHAASAPGRAGALRRARRGSCRLDELTPVDRLASDRTTRPLVRVADQPDAALRGHSRGRLGVPGLRRDVGHRQHLRQPDQSAAAGVRRRPGHAQRHEVSERPQRRDRGRAWPGRQRSSNRIARTPAPPRNDSRSPAGLCARPRPEDAAGAGRAAERQRPGDRRIPRPGTRA